MNHELFMVHDSNRESWIMKRELKYERLEFLVDSIFVLFAGKVFQQIVGMPIGTNCAPLLADIFLNTYEADFL